MKKLSILMLAVGLFVLTGCKPNLKVKKAKLDFDADQVSYTEKNTGWAKAGPHLTYIEINKIGAAASAKPQSQYSVRVPAIGPLGTWSSGPICLSKFSTRGDIDLLALGHANLVIRVDAKDVVDEYNENDNVYDQDH